jgi:GTPase
MFVDEARVKVVSGSGGGGAVSFEHMGRRGKGRPDGGDGGRGGAVVFVADAGVGSLIGVRDRPHRKAKDGGVGRSNNRKGADGGDLEVAVPVGCVVKDERGAVLADLVSKGDRFVVAGGGRGGRGNAAFLSGRRRAPGFGELGEPGEETEVYLELRSIADVAVIGFPNAGKSTLVGALSGAKPKVADYPFTTTEPTLGVVEVGDVRFTICDIPGLIEGAHEGKGLGLKFLRHAERAPVFCHLVDLGAGRDQAEDHRVVREELRRYRADLDARAEVVVLNKVDAVSGRVVEEAVEAFRARGVDALAISAKDGDGVPALLDRLVGMVGEARAANEREGFELFRTVPDRVSVRREGNAWRVSGKKVQRWVAMTDFGNPEAVSYLQGRLERGGVEKALAEAGAVFGDEVRIGAAAFEWWTHTDE